MDKVCEHDKREIEKLLMFKEQIKRTREVTKNMTYDERIKWYISSWTEEGRNYDL